MEWSSVIPRRCTDRRRRPECVPLEVQVLVEDWRIEDNTVRPPSALGYRTPSQYARAWSINQPPLSHPMDHQPGSGHCDPTHGFGAVADRGGAMRSPPAPPRPTCEALW
jgi:hypothetical protein